MKYYEIPNLDGMYLITKAAQVKVKKREWVTGKNLKRVKEEHVIKPFIKRNGYLHIAVLANGKASQYPLHTLLARTFLPNPHNKKCVNHKDGNKLNNRIDNLEWATYAENNNHSIQTGLRVNPTGITNGYSSPVDVFVSGVHLGKFPTLKSAAIALNIGYDKVYRISIGERKNSGYKIDRISREQYLQSVIL